MNIHKRRTSRIKELSEGLVSQWHPLLCVPVQIRCAIVINVKTTMTRDYHALTQYIINPFKSGANTV